MYILNKKTYALFADFLFLLHFFLFEGQKKKAENDFRRD